MCKLIRSVGTAHLILAGIARPTAIPIAWRALPYTPRSVLAPTTSVFANLSPKRAPDSSE